MQKSGAAGRLGCKQGRLLPRLLRTASRLSGRAAVAARLLVGRTRGGNIPVWLAAAALRKHITIGLGATSWLAARLALLRPPTIASGTRLRISRLTRLPL